MGIYDRDYMRKDDPEETIRQYEKERMAAEYGDAHAGNAAGGKKAVIILGIIILAVIVLGVLCSL